MDSQDDTRPSGERKPPPLSVQHQRELAAIIERRWDSPDLAERIIAWAFHRGVGIVDTAGRVHALVTPWGDIA